MSGTGDRLGAVLRVELVRFTRDRIGLFFFLVLPVLVIVIIGTSFGGAPEEYAIGVVDTDGTVLSETLADRLERSGALETERYADVEEMRRDARVGRLVGGVVIPAGFERRVESGGEASVNLELEQLESSAAAVRSAVGGAVDELARTSAAARFATEQGAGDYETNLALARELDDDLPAPEIRVVDVSTGGGPGSFADLSGSGFDYTVPSQLVLFTFINSLIVGAVLVETRRLGMIRRILAGPVSAGAVVGGIGVSRFVFALGQSGLIVLLGALAFGVSWGDPLGAAALVVLFGLVATGAGLLIGSVARTPEQDRAIGIPLAIVLAMLGGCMWPLEVVPSTMRTIGHVTPHAWAMDAWITLVFDRGGLGDITTELAVLAGFAVVLLGLASWRLRAGVLRG